MGYLIGLIILVVVAGFVLSAVLPILGYISLFAFVATTAVALIIGVVEFVSAAFAGFARTATIEGLRVEPPPATENGPDPAYRSYYAGPVLFDYGRVVEPAIRQVVTRLLTGTKKPVPKVPWIRRVWDVLDEFDSTWWKVGMFLPVTLTIVGAVAGTAATVVLVMVTSIVFFVLLGLLVLGTLATAGIARVVEFAVLFVRGITIECPSCHDHATNPVYRCPTCSARHRKLVPGLAGVSHRTCQCVATLPTLIAFGKAKLAAQCATCGAQLPVKGLTAPTFHIPVIAGPTAGKSIFMHTAVTRLLVRGEEDGFEFADQKAKDEFERNIALGVSNDPRRITKTKNMRPRAYNVYVGREKTTRRRLLYLYDPAGEIPESPEQLADSQFLRHTKGAVFVIDPFSLRAVRASTDRAFLQKVNASNSNARDVLERFTETLRERVGKNSSGRLDLRVAVVITKADALRETSTVRHPYANLEGAAIDPALRTERDTAVRDWLREAGNSGDLVASLASNFATISYFVVSFEDAHEVSERAAQRTTVTNDDPATPLLWLLYGKAAP